MAPRFVAVSQRIDDLQDRNERRDAVDQALIQWLEEVGFTGVPVPNVWTTETLRAWLAALDPVAVVLSGGNDIGTCADRDATERALIEWAAARKRPLLGICRGMQMMAVAAGGELKRVEGHVRTRHDLGVDFGRVNSFHDMALVGLPPGYTCLARSEDGEIEAIQHTSNPMFGWMWHPERERPFDANHLTMARALLSGQSQEHQ